MFEVTIENYFARS